MVWFYDGSDGVFGYSDSDWGGDLSTRKSTSGYVFTFGGTAFSWKSKLQTVVAASSTEAEYVAHALAVKEALWIRWIVNELGLTNGKVQMKIFSDSTGAISIGKDNVISPRTKHIAISYHLVCDYIAKGFVRITYISTVNMVADIFTKALTKSKFRKCVWNIGMRKIDVNDH